MTRGAVVSSCPAELSPGLYTPFCQVREPSTRGSTMIPPGFLWTDKDRVRSSFAKSIPHHPRSSPQELCTAIAAFLASCPQSYPQGRLRAGGVVLTVGASHRAHPFHTRASMSDVRDSMLPEVFFPIPPTRPVPGCGGVGARPKLRRSACVDSVSYTHLTLPTTPYV